MHAFQHHRSSPIHVFVSPCFDKKLEILRPNYNGVDLVLSTTELIELISRPHKQEQHQPPSRTWQSVCNSLGLCSNWSVAATDCDTGGGFAQSMLADGETGWTASINRERLNPDLLFTNKLWRSHGFRNIQNITKKFKNGKLKSAKFLEIMACPGGCPRGGGQPRDSVYSENRNSSLVEKIIEKFSKLFFPISQPITEKITCDPDEFEIAVWMRSVLISALGGEDAWNSQIRTEWKSIPVNSSVKW